MKPIPGWILWVLFAAVPGFCQAGEAPISAVVNVRTEIPADARTARSLGPAREGSGVVIDSGGLILTIGYIVLEAQSVEVTDSHRNTVPGSVVGYDHATGFGLIRTRRPPEALPMTLGDSARAEEGRRVLVASHNGQEPALQPAFVVSRRSYAGSWEYLLERAIFTAPPHPNFGGAALVGAEGRLLGIGSLFVVDARRGEPRLPGNMFVPINLLKPILADMILQGRSAESPRPWLGVNVEDSYGRVFVRRVSAGGPAEKAGLRSGDLIVGVGGAAVQGLADFYRKLWAHGDAGVAVTLNVLRGVRVHNVDVISANRYDYLRLKPAY